MQALYDLLAPGGVAPNITITGGQPDSPGPFLLEVILAERRGRGRWWRPNGAGYTDQLDRAGVYTLEDLRVQSRVKYPDDGHSRLVDARVIVGPALRLLFMLHGLEAACPDGYTQMGAMLEPADHEPMRVYMALRDAGRLLRRTPSLLTENELAATKSALRAADPDGVAQAHDAGVPANELDKFLLLRWGAAHEPKQPEIRCPRCGGVMSKRPPWSNDGEYHCMVQACDETSQGAE